ncbi:maltoporin [Eleftheria terrae]|uniref:maltoporin n=1 Tax=Eleftheria terrae TaxID=1597781 RepID=UPI00263BA6D1|nr:carbohydrate porin [Eleftheria terrae]WKB52965.1 carbohydrate porin [Eleftheria terrae]
MRGRFKLLAIAAAAAGAFGTAQAQSQGLEFNGYFRTGVGSSSEGSKQACFQNPATGDVKYRLGNECETYGEVAFSLPFGKKDTGPYAKYTLMLATKEDNGASDAESVDGDKFDIMSRQNFIQAGGFFGPGALQDAKVWVGKRYYNRHDVHINDYYYWNNSGLGGGIEDIALGQTAKLAIAYHQKGDDQDVTDTANALNTRRLSARVYDIAVNQGGKLEAELAILKGDSSGAPYEIQKDGSKKPVGKGSGFALFVEHMQTGILGGYNKLALVYGQDAGAGGKYIPTYRNATDNVDGKEFRLVEQLFIAPAGSNWSGQGVFGYQHYKPDNGDKQTWLTIGVRPQYNFTDNFSLAFELGHDRTKTEGSPAAKLTKFTVAPQLSLGRGFWSRPVFRAFATYAKWNDEAGDAKTGGVFGDDNNGMTYGIQVEAWW